MKKFRKISSLALVLVLVCLCTASAFAATTTDGHNYNYFDTSLTVTAEDYLVSSSIVVDGNYTSLSGYTTVTGYYYTSRYDATIATQTKREDLRVNRNGVTASITFDESEIFIVHKAVGLYRATVVTVAATVNYAPDNLTAVFYTK